LSRIGPLASVGSTGFPPCVMTSLPLATSRRAALRTGSIQARHCSPGWANRATSLGQIETPPRRDLRTLVIKPSRWDCVRSYRFFRHLAEQYLMASQLPAERRRQAKRRPQLAHVFSGLVVTSATSEALILLSRRAVLDFAQTSQQCTVSQQTNFSNISEDYLRGLIVSISR